MSGHLHIIGGGIAGLASAAFAIRDARMAGGRITIYDANAVPGGSLDAGGDVTRGYVMRGERMLSPHFVCLYDLLSGIPSFDNPHISARDDIFAFTRACGWESKARLVRADGSKVDTGRLGLSFADRAALLRLMLRSEASIGAKAIRDVFPPHFFTTNFWLMWCTMFAFEPLHSAIEMRRYLRRFLHLFPHLASMRTVHRTRYNQHHSIVVPLLRWLEAEGVRFERGCRVTDIEITGMRRATALQVGRDGMEERIALGEHDCAIFCNGSMTAGSSLGACTHAAPALCGADDGSWALWKRIAAGRPEFGRPDVFCGDPRASRWVSFTATTRTPRFRQLLEAFTAAPLGREGLITFVDSNWLLTIKANPSPHFPGQPGDTVVWWGYGLNMERPGNFVAKTMPESSGSEMLRETFGHLRLAADTDQLMAESRAIPCLMPLITSQFMPRAPGDRPPVRPSHLENLAFVGQFVELPDDTVFTVEYSVRTAMEAVKALLKPDLAVPPIYKGWRNPAVWLRAAREAMR